MIEVRRLGDLTEAEWRTRAELMEAEVERLRAELERARRPWWRRWFGS